MSVLTTLKEVLQASTESANRGDPIAEESKGAYWCHDCNERIRDVEVAESEMRAVSKHQVWLGRVKRRLDEVATRLTYGR